MEPPAGPEIDPPEGRYEWNQIQGGGVLITFPKTPIEQVLHWRIEWLRPGLRTGCKFSGYTTILPDGSPAAEDWSHHMDSEENIVPGVTTRMYEVVNVGVPAKTDQVQDAPMPPPPSTG
eukprot:g14406.t1